MIRYCPLEGRSVPLLAGRRSLGFGIVSPMAARFRYCSPKGARFRYCPPASSGSSGAVGEGQKSRLVSFESAAVRRTDRLYIYRVGGRFGRSHFVKMHSIWPAQGAL